MLARLMMIRLGSALQSVTDYLKHLADDAIETVHPGRPDAMLHTGPEPVAIDDRIIAAPISTIWL